MKKVLKQSPIHIDKQLVYGDYHGWSLPTIYSDGSHELTQAQASVVLADGSVNGRYLVEGGVDEGLIDGEVYRLRPDLWFVRTRPGQTLTLPNTTAHVTLTDMTHGYAEIHIIGPHSATLISRACGLNFSDKAFPNQTAKHSSVAKTRQLIIRHDLGDMPAYALIGERSLATYLWETLLVSGRDLSIIPIGQTAFSQIQAKS